MTTTTANRREERFKWLIRPFLWAFEVCLMSALFGVSFATDTSFPETYVIAGLIASMLAVSGLLAWGVIRMRATYEG